MTQDQDQNATLHCFSADEYDKAKRHLATQVAMMMGRKLEEGDWSSVYCAAKAIPVTTWSNLNIDINHNGVGVEQKLKFIELLLAGVEAS